LTQGDKGRELKGGDGMSSNNAMVDGVDISVLEGWLIKDKAKAPK